MQQARAADALLLKARIEEARQGAEKLLGFQLRAEHFARGHAYALLPAGHVDVEEFEGVKRGLQARMRAASDLGAEEEAKTRLLHYLLLHKPIDGRAFRKALSVHLDAMLEALVELRCFGIYENGERGTEAAYDNEKAPCHRV
jgi:hypothetical protein